jgi:hypothetical protein
MDLVQIGWGDVDCIGLTQDMDKLITLLISTVNLRFHTILGNYRVATQLVASRRVLRYMEFYIIIEVCNVR